MPHYDYECKDCGHTFEVFQQINDKPLTECPKCKGSVRRLIGTGSGLIFKGTGFYVTDYKRNTNEGKKEAKSSPEKSSESCSSCPSESKSC